jgi:hypothetical protein
VDFFYVTLGLISLAALIFYDLDVTAKTVRIFGTILFVTALSHVGFILRHNTLILGLVLLFALIFYSFNINKKPVKILATILVLTSLFQVGIILIYRGNQLARKMDNTPTLSEMKEQKKRKLDFIHTSGAGLTSSVVTYQNRQSFLEPFLGKIFTEVIPVSTQNESYKKMRESRLPQMVFIENYDKNSAHKITEAARGKKAYSVNLIYSSYNRLRFHVSSETTAIFGLSYPYTGHWRAWVNGNKVHLYRANGATHAVEIPSGESIVEFRYWSNASFWGMVISFTTLVVIGFFVCFTAFTGLQRYLGIILILFIGIGGFMLWYNSLYSGNNLGTEYIWNYESPSDKVNLAYGKKSWVEPSLDMDYFDDRGLDFSASRLTDGNTSPGSGAITFICQNHPSVYTSLYIDLNQSEQIKTVVLYEGYPGLSVNIRPLEILFSQNRINWSHVNFIVSPIGSQVPLKLNFEKPKTARFIQIRGKGCLKFDEVEVYGQKDI